MKERTFSVLGNLTLITLVSMVGLIPLVFSPTHTDSFEIPKAFFLIIGITLFTTLFLALSFYQGNIKIAIGYFTVPILLFLFWVTLSTIFSVDKAASFSGWLKNYPGTLLSVLLATILYLVITSLMRKTATVKKVFVYFFVSTVIQSFLGILSAFKIFLLPFTQSNQAFWTTGGTNVELSGFLSVLGLLIGFSLLLQTQKSRPTPLLVLITVSNLIIFSYLALLNLVSLWILLILGAVVFLTLTKGYIQQNVIFIFATVILSLFILILRFFFFGNTEVPKTISLPFNEGLSITLQTIAKYPILGSGPATFDHNYRLFRSDNFMQSSLFQIDFPNSSYWFLDLTASNGFLGLVIYLSIFVVILSYLIKYYRSDQTQDPLKNLLAILISLNATFMVSTFLLGRNTMTFFFIFLTLALTAAILKVNFPLPIKEYKFKFSDTGWLITIFMVVVFIWSIHIGQKIFRADMYRYQSFRNTTSAQETSYNQLLKAIRIAKNYDELHRDFSLINLALAVSVTKNNNLDDKEKLETATKLIQQSLNEAKAATTVNPQDSRNWKLHGDVLLQLADTLQADSDQIKEKFDKALALDPKNPDLHLGLARVENRQKNYTQAISILTNALDIKSNYFPLRQELAESYLLQAELEPSKKVNYYQLAKSEFERVLTLEGTTVNKSIIENKLKQINSVLGN